MSVKVAATAALAAPARCSMRVASFPVSHRLCRCSAKNMPQPTTAAPKAIASALVSDAANGVRGAWTLKIPSPKATKTICAIISVVTSTAVDAKATAVATPWMMAARAPNTIPPSCENGSTSLAASRTMRAHTKIHTLWRASGSNARQAIPKSRNNASVYRQRMANPRNPAVKTAESTAPIPTNATR